MVQIYYFSYLFFVRLKNVFLAKLSVFSKFVVDDWMDTDRKCWNTQELYGLLTSLELEVLTVT